MGFPAGLFFFPECAKGAAMKPTLSFHRVDRMEFSAVKMYPPHKDRPQPFWAREVTIHGEGGQFDFCLFSDSETGILLPGETAVNSPENEPDAPKAELPAVDAKLSEIAF